MTAVVQQTCPRRMTEFGPWEHVENLDTWRPYCSFCGSMNPDEFMAAVRDGAKVGPTDKSYKFYVGVSHEKFYTPHLRPEQSAEFRQLWEAGSIVWGEPGGPYRPVYLPGLVPAAEEKEAG